MRLMIALLAVLLLPAPLRADSYALMDEAFRAAQQGMASAAGAALRQIGQQRRLQRAMDDERRIGFFIHRIGAVIMDAMAVHGQRRIAEQQHRIGGHRALPRC